MHDTGRLEEQLAIWRRTHISLRVLIQHIGVEADYVSLTMGRIEREIAAHKCAEASAPLAQLAAEQGVKPCEDISKMELDVPEAAEMFEGMEAAKVCVWRKSAWKWWYGSCRATLDSSPNITWNRCPYCGKPIRIEKGAKP